MVLRQRIGDIHICSKKQKPRLVSLWGSSLSVSLFKKPGAGHFGNES